METGRQDLAVACAAIISCQVTTCIQHKNVKSDHALRRIQYHLFFETTVKHGNQAVQTEVHLLTSVFHSEN
jgi:hypothetical protein